MQYSGYLYMSIKFIILMPRLFMVSPDLSSNILNGLIAVDQIGTDTTHRFDKAVPKNLGIIALLFTQFK